MSGRRTYALTSNPRERWLVRRGWEINHHSAARGVETWLRPHPNDVAGYSTARAIWVTLTGRARRGGSNAGWRIWSEGR